MIHQMLKSAEITVDFSSFFTIGFYYDSLLNSKNYILQQGHVIFT